MTLLACRFALNPTPAQERALRSHAGAARVAFSAVSLVPAYLPELADLSDDELRQALRTIMLHILRVPAERPALRCRPRR